MDLGWSMFGENRRIRPRANRQSGFPQLLETGGSSANVVSEFGGWPSGQGSGSIFKRINRHAACADVLSRQEGANDAHGCCSQFRPV